MVEVAGHRFVKFTIDRAVLCSCLNAREAESALFLVGVGIGHPVDPNDTAEFAALAASAGAIRVGQVLASRPRPDPKYFVGSGKAEEIRACAEENNADVVLVDQTLTPSQERNLEKLTGRRVLDRNGLILDIFAQRARSFEGKLQVELAQLSHLATPPGPRLDPPRAPEGRHRLARPG